MIITVNDSESRFIGMRTGSESTVHNTVAVNQHDFFSHENSLLSSQNLYTRR